MKCTDYTNEVKPLVTIDDKKMGYQRFKLSCVYFAHL
jgi:hypothetical protein